MLTSLRSRSDKFAEPNLLQVTAKLTVFRIPDLVCLRPENVSRGRCLQNSWWNGRCLLSKHKEVLATWGCGLMFKEMGRKIAISESLPMISEKLVNVGGVVDNLLLYI